MLIWRIGTLSCWPIIEKDADNVSLPHVECEMAQRKWTLILLSYWGCGRNFSSMFSYHCFYHVFKGYGRRTLT